MQRHSLYGIQFQSDCHFDAHTAHGFGTAITSFFIFPSFYVKSRTVFGWCKYKPPRGIFEVRLIAGLLVGQQGKLLHDSFLCRFYIQRSLLGKTVWRGFSTGSCLQIRSSNGTVPKLLCSLSFYTTEREVEFISFTDKTNLLAAVRVAVTRALLNYTINSQNERKRESRISARSG